MKFSFTFFILLGILVLIYFIAQENEKDNTNISDKEENKKKGKKKRNENKIVSKDSLIEKYNDTESENIINYGEETSNESIFDNDENFDNVYHNFIESSIFNGEKKGYIFKNGSEGLGYYVDDFAKKLNSRNVYLEE